MVFPTKKRTREARKETLTFELNANLS